MTGQDVISAQRLAEIREIDAAFDTTKPHPFPTRVYAHRRELLAEVDRLTTALAEARDDADFTQALANLRQLTAERDQARARVAELEDKTRAIRSHIRVHQHILADRQRENPQSATIAAKLQMLDQIAACLDHMHDEPQPAAPDRSDGSAQ